MQCATGAGGKAGAVQEDAGTVNEAGHPVLPPSGDDPSGVPARRELPLLRGELGGSSLDAGEVLGEEKCAP